jgi:hypothetical protein
MVVLFWTNRVIILPNQEHLYSFGFGHNFNQQEYRYSQLPETKASNKWQFHALNVPDNVLRQSPLNIQCMELPFI